MDGFFAELMQYENIADALANIEKTVEYVVEISIKYKETFQAGKLLINRRRG